MGKKMSEDDELVADKELVETPNNDKDASMTYEINEIGSGNSKPEFEDVCD